MGRLTLAFPKPWASDLRGPCQLASISMAQDPVEGSASAAPHARAMGTWRSLWPGPHLSGPGVHPQLLGQRQKGGELLEVQEQVDGHPAVGGGIHQVQKQVRVSEDVHDQGHQLGVGRGAVGGAWGSGGYSVGGALGVEFKGLASTGCSHDSSMRMGKRRPSLKSPASDCWKTVTVTNGEWCPRSCDTTRQPCR